MNLEEKKKEIRGEDEIGMIKLEKLILIDNETKKEIALTVEEEGELNKLYWIQLLLAGIIATLGLLQNSIPVVIGVMLIAPLLRPIQSFSFGIVSAHHGRTWMSFKNILLSFLLVVASSMAITWLIPIELETAEVLSRTNPNILDFFIAAASAAIAFLALVYKKKLSMSIAGVAMAASLLPPLSVIGIEIIYGNYFLAWNSFLLFFTNIVAIVFTGIVLFFIFGFKPHQDEDKIKFKKNMIVLLFSISLISLPLITSIINLNKQVKKEIFVNKKIEIVFDKNNLDIYNIDFKQHEESKNNILLEAKYYGEKKDIHLLNEKINILKTQFKKKFNEEIKLELDISLFKKIK